MSQTNLEFDLPLPQDLKNNKFRSYKPPNSTLSHLTEEEKQEKERARTELISKCRDFIFRFIMQQAPRIMAKSLNERKSKKATIFKYNFIEQPQGERTRNFSYVVINKETERCHFAFFRPKDHSDDNLWYFPIAYMMNGFSLNSARTFQALGLTPVEVDIKKNFEQRSPKYTIRCFYSKQYGNSVCVYMDVTPTNTKTPSSPRSSSPKPENKSAESSPSE